MAKAYTTEFRQSIVRQLVGPSARTQGEVSRETGIPQATLSRWLRKAQARTLSSMASKRRRWSLEEKLRVLAEASRLRDDELGAFLRREGLHEQQLQEWREAVRGVLSTSSGSRGGSRSSPEEKRIRDLERELRRKDKALSEAAALLVLSKKVEALWGVEDDSTTGRSAK